MTDIPFVISPGAIEEYKTIIREEQGIELTDQEAYEQARGLLTLGRMIVDAERKKPEERPQDDAAYGKQMSLL